MMLLRGKSSSLRSLFSRYSKPQNPRPPPPHHVPSAYAPCSRLFSAAAATSTTSRFIGSSRSFYKHNPLFQRFKRSYFVVMNSRVEGRSRRGKAIVVLIACGTLIVVEIACGVALSVAYFERVETVPYSKRKHSMLVPPALERGIGEYLFYEMKKDFGDKILPDTHPETIRVRRLSKEIIDAAERGLQLHEYQKGANWEVIVVKDSRVNAFCRPGGKIVVYNGLLDHFKTDLEISTVIGREVGHAIARHSAESISKRWYLWLLDTHPIIPLALLYPGFVNRVSAFLFRLPFSQQMDNEADYIGLMLLASAGYDPRAAPKVYEKLGRMHEDGSAKSEYLSRHPSCETKAKLLSQDKVMEEALAVYRETVAGRGGSSTDKEKMTVAGCGGGSTNKEKETVAGRGGGGSSNKEKEKKERKSEGTHMARLAPPLGTELAELYSRMESHSHSGFRSFLFSSGAKRTNRWDEIGGTDGIRQSHPFRGYQMRP